jgi:hypothetical protein
MVNGTPETRCAREPQHVRAHRGDRDDDQRVVDEQGGACPKCRATGARPATLGCGTLFLIGLVVAIFSRPGLGDLESNLGRLRVSVEELKKASDTQTNEIRELRKVIDEQRKGAAGKDK